VVNNNRNLRNALDQAIESLNIAQNSEIDLLLKSGYFDRLLMSIAKPKKDTSQTIYDFLLENKNRLASISWIHNVIVRQFYKHCKA